MPYPVVLEEVWADSFKKWNVHFALKNEILGKCILQKFHKRDIKGKYLGIKHVPIYKQMSLLTHTLVIIGT